MTKEEIMATMKPENFVGRAPEQVVEFIEAEVKPIVEKYKSLLGVEVEINV